MVPAWLAGIIIFTVATVPILPVKTQSVVQVLATVEPATIPPPAQS